MLYVIFFSLVGGLFSLVGGALLLAKKSKLNKFAYYATPFAAGSLIAAVFLDLLKEGLEVGDSSSLMTAALVGILVFFLAERFLYWFHHHHDADENKKAVSKTLIIFGDMAHNFMDGIAIGAAFLVSPATGIVTVLVVAAHEIPQEIGDFGLLIDRGMKRSKVLIANVLTSLATTLAAVTVYALGDSNKLPLGVMLGLSAGFLLYIAMSDVLPSLHPHKKTKKRTFLDSQTIMLLLGVVIVAIAVNMAHDFLPEDSHNHSGATMSEHADYDMHDHDH